MQAVTAQASVRQPYVLQYVDVMVANRPPAELPTISPVLAELTFSVILSEVGGEAGAKDLGGDGRRISRFFAALRGGERQTELGTTSR